MSLEVYWRRYGYCPTCELNGPVLFHRGETPRQTIERRERRRPSLAFVPAVSEAPR